LSVVVVGWIEKGSGLFVCLLFGVFSFSSVKTTPQHGRSTNLTYQFLS
jgi:hypothetical protein